MSSFLISYFTGSNTIVHPPSILNSSPLLNLKLLYVFSLCPSLFPIVVDMYPDAKSPVINPKSPSSLFILYVPAFMSLGKLYDPSDKDTDVKYTGVYSL